MLRGIFNLNKSWEAHPTKRELYANIPPITKKNQGKEGDIRMRLLLFQANHFKY